MQRNPIRSIQKNFKPDLDFRASVPAEKPVPSGGYDSMRLAAPIVFPAKLALAVENADL